MACKAVWTGSTPVPAKGTSPSLGPVLLLGLRRQRMMFGADRRVSFILAGRAFDQARRTTSARPLLKHKAVLSARSKPLLPMQPAALALVLSLRAQGA